MSIGVLSDRWAVNGTPIYEPSPGTHILHTSISSADSGRTENGRMHNTWVIQNLVKVNMVWSCLTGNEVAYLVNLMQGQEFTLTYYEYGATHTAYVYVAEINYDMDADGHFANEGGLCTNIAINAIEM